MTARAHVIISGLVQGVFFRTTIRARAKMLGLKGWVRSTEEGKVEAVFEGEKENIDEMIDFCKKGPVGAMIETAIVKWETPTGRFEGFGIKSDFSEPKEEKEEETEEIEVEEVCAEKEEELPEILAEEGAKEKKEEKGDEMVSIKRKNKKTFVVGGEEMEEEEPEW